MQHIDNVSTTVAEEPYGAKLVNFMLTKEKSKSPWYRERVINIFVHTSNIYLYMHNGVSNHICCFIHGDKLFTNYGDSCKNKNHVFNVL